MMNKVMLKLLERAKRRYPSLQNVEFHVFLDTASMKSSTYFEWGPNVTIEKAVINLTNDVTLKDVENEVACIVARLTGKLLEIVKEELCAN